MPNVEELIDQQRRRLLRREGTLVADVQQLYQRALTDLVAQANRAAQLVATRIQQGQDPLSALISERRVSALLEQLRAEMLKAGTAAFGEVETARRNAIIATAADFRDLAGALEVRVGIDPRAIERQALALGVGSPVAELFADLPREAEQHAREALFSAVARGQNPRILARELAGVVTGGAARASTIARTEVLRSYRGAMGDRYTAADWITGWIWISARDRRTCAFCWAQHGTRHPADQRMATHPNCRCSMAPETEASGRLIRPGIEAFNKLPESDKLHILGPAKYRAMSAGAISLRDLVGKGRHPKWGEVGFERSLTAVLGPDARQYYRGGLTRAPTRVPAPRKAVDPRRKPTR